VEKGIIQNTKPAERVKSDKYRLYLLLT